MANPTGNAGPAPDPVALYNRMDKQLQKLNKEAEGQDKLFGISVFGLGVPNEMFGFDMRTGGQQAAQQAPLEYAKTMSQIVNMLRDALEACQDPYGQKQTASGA